MNSKAVTTIDKYIADFPPEVKAILEKIRQEIKKIAPTAVEAISYQMPTFKLNGKNLVHFAAWKNHIGFYPTPSGTKEFEKDLSSYNTSKGAVQFPFDQEMPYELMMRIVKFRINENLKITKPKK